eukprot:TRINITY_DN29930_c0_g1_i1.p1 TRINITY_DN29930_c0_g1~~TRINITY_DN29930_c0_g1_i1.p1  ORF type:complete len:101 (-),score=7.87 TRINITY_DN29930_c0_g1_i1:70-372(-)
MKCIKKEEKKVERQDKIRLKKTQAWRNKKKTCDRIAYPRTRAVQYLTKGECEALASSCNGSARLSFHVFSHSIGGRLLYFKGKDILPNHKKGDNNKIIDK